MRKLFTLFLLHTSLAAVAQWNTTANPPHISYSGGRVGVGTSNPQADLDLRVDNASMHITASNATAGGVGHPYLYINRISEGLKLEYVPNVLARISNTFLGPTGNLAFATAGQDRLIISGTGGVGIGSSSFEGKLTINTEGDKPVIRLSGGSEVSFLSLSSKWNLPSTTGNAAYLPTITTAWDAAGGIGIIEGAGVSSPLIWMYAAQGRNAFTIARKTDDPNGANITNIDNYLIPLFQVRENGNVGIGTTNPNQKLTVNGTIYGKEVKVDLNVPGPDYVFEPTYQLPSLTETEAYIKAHKHLPEIPSAKEMEEQGINLSEMNMLLNVVYLSPF